MTSHSSWPRRGVAMLLLAAALPAQFNAEAMSITIDRQSVRPYQQVTFTAKFRSTSGLARNVRWGVFVSPDNRITQGDALVASGATDLLTPFVTKTVTGTFDVPPSWIPGQQYVGLFVDYENNIRETNEGDNTKAIPFTIEAFPDLVAEQLSVSGDIAGETIQVDFQVRNLGNQISGHPGFPPRVGVFLGTSTTHANADFYLGAFDVLLQPGDRRSFRLTSRIPAAIDGQYQVHVVADYQQRLTELNESNNHVRKGLIVRSVLPGKRLVEWLPRLQTMASAHDFASTLADSGGVADLAVVAPPFAHRRYLCLWSTTPTFGFDAATEIGLALVNTQIMPNWFGTLDARGIARASLQLPPLPGASGFSVYTHALLESADGRLEFVPTSIRLQLR